MPALAAPGEWHQFLAADPAAMAEPVEPMAFERPGESFPGSAFFYLAERPTVSTDDVSLVPGVHSDAGTARAQISTAGPAARPLVTWGSASSQDRALQCLTMAVYYEAASEADSGQRAVAQVVLNRVAHPTYPNTVCGVVFQGSARKTGCQFTFTCDGSLARRPAGGGWERARRIARESLAGAVYAPVGLATHYHTIRVNPYWAKTLNRIGTIGEHHFYRWRGKAGTRAAFRASYAGAEPGAEPYSIGGGDTGTTKTPAILSRAPEIGQAPRTDAANIAEPAPSALSGTVRLPGSGSIRPEYAHSGQWIAKPQ